MSMIGFAQRDRRRWLRHEVEWSNGPSCPSLSLTLLAELAWMARKPFGWLALQHTVFLSSGAFRCLIGNYILCFPCCVTFYIYISSVLSVLSNPVCFPCCTVSIPVMAQGFAELTLLFMSLPTSPYKKLTFYWYPCPCIEISCQQFLILSPVFAL